LKNKELLSFEDSYGEKKLETFKKFKKVPKRTTLPEKRKKWVLFSKYTFLHQKNS